MNVHYLRKGIVICLVMVGILTLKRCYYVEYSDVSTMNLFEINQEAYKNLDYGNDEPQSELSQIRELVKPADDLTRLEEINVVKVTGESPLEKITNTSNGRQFSKMTEVWEKKMNGEYLELKVLQSQKEKQKDDENHEDDNSQDDGKEGDKEGLSLENSQWIYGKEEDSMDEDSALTDANEVKFIYYYDYEKRGALVKSTMGPTMVGCPNKCEYVFDPTEADMVVFNGMSLRLRPLTPTNIWKRPSHQQWIYISCDPVDWDNGLDDKFFRAMFNWTSTYRSDSDLPEYLGMLQHKSSPNASRNYSEIFHKKTKLAAWFVSRCKTQSLREVYVKRMTKVAPVDIFGRCGPLKCEQHSYTERCLPLLTNTYKFYLAFESQFCDQYVSEKFFKVFEDVQVIPVVRGAVDYNNAFPKDTFVNTADFNTPEDLMKHLVQLGTDEKTYVKMLQAKDQWEKGRLEERKIMCKICKHLHTNGKGQQIPNVAEAVRGSSDVCWPPKDL